MKERTSSTTYGSPFEREMTLLLQECFEDMDSGDPARIARWNSDPYWEAPDGHPGLTQEDADRIIAALDEEYGKEIESFGEYHKRRSGANAKPEWTRLQPSQRVGLIQRLFRVIEKYP